MNNLKAFLSFIVGIGILYFFTTFDRYSFNHQETDQETRSGRQIIENQVNEYQATQPQMSSSDDLSFSVDKEPKNIAKANEDKNESPNIVIDTTEDELAKADQNIIKNINPADLRVQTHKWEGKIVQVKLNCFYADENEYRCITDGARIDFTFIIPEKEANLLQKQCDSITKIESKSCTRVIRFIYEKFGEFDAGGLAGVLTAIKAKSDTGMIVQNRIQRQ